MSALILSDRPELGLRVIYSPHYELATLILREVISPRDAAAIRAGVSEETPLMHLRHLNLWRDPLAIAYDADPHRLWAHGVLLGSSSLTHCLEQLAMSPVSPELSRELSRAILIESRAMLGEQHTSASLTSTMRKESRGEFTREEIREEIIEEAREFEARWLKRHRDELITRWDATPEPALRASALRDLLRCRRELYREAALKLPSLTLIHTTALGSSGRGGVTSQGERVVAISLSEPSQWWFCQALHEEVHAVTDQGYTKSQRAQRDTRVDSTGYQEHRALEQSAVQRASGLIAQRCPQRIQDDLAWRVALGIYVAPQESAELRVAPELIEIKRFSPERRRLIIGYLICVMSVWGLTLISPRSALALSVLTLLLGVALALYPSRDPSRSSLPLNESSSGLISKLHAGLGVETLNLNQRLALTMSLGIHVAALIALFDV